CARMGIGPSGGRAVAAGVDGCIVPDLPLEEAAVLGEPAEARGLSLVLLAAPTTPPERLRAIGERTRGFVYYVSVTGVTGARAVLPPERPPGLDRARAPTPAPGALGF